MTYRDWLVRYASELGVEPPSDALVETVLSLAGAAAHASERQAAPIACWLAAAAGLDPQEALRRAEALRADG